MPAITEQSLINETNNEITSSINQKTHSNRKFKQ